MAQKSNALVVALAAYCAASLLHFAHNAEFAADYPNFPESMTAGKVYLAWLGVTAVGLVGCGLVWRGFRVAGFLLLALYALQGFDGLLHYHLAPISAHTPMMNFTIWFEVAMAAVLLVVLAWQRKKT